MFRNTYVEVNLDHLTTNVSKVIHAFPKYQYYLGVVKADCYGHGVENCIDSIIQGGCNYLAVATLEEALEIRKINKKIPILCLGIISPIYADIERAAKESIAITISSKAYFYQIGKLNIQNIKCHLKINTGMNRLGISSKEEVNEVIEKFANSNMVLEGIYTHIYQASNQEATMKQFQQFDEILKEVDKSQIPIIHTSASEALIHYEGLDYVNGCRLGIIMYGFSSKEQLKLESTFRLVSQVIQINELQKGEKLGYEGIYVAEKEERIAVVAIGYADGVIRKNTGRNVYIQGKPYPIIGNICMDMLFVRIDDTVRLYDEVEVYQDNKHIENVAAYLDTIPYEVMCLVGKRVPRIYIKNEKKKEK